MKHDQKTYDVCLVLEGTYPYVSGGVSSWVHELITEQNHLSFCLVCLMPPGFNKTHRYEMPDNVHEKIDITLQQSIPGKSEKNKKKIPSLIKSLQVSLEQLHSQETSLTALEKLIQTVNNNGKPLSTNFLLNSKEAWQLLISMYRETYPNASYINYFWSWRAILSSVYSVILSELPKAKVYHSVCTGYAGLYLARAHIETGASCLLTEHGIYTNERRIELASAAWLDGEDAMNLNVSRKGVKELRDFWMDAFYSYSKLAYDACDKIVTLYEGNFKLQIEDGADSNKLMVIANGIDYEKYSNVNKTKNHAPTVALIGRVVPIKDIKAYIMSIAILHKTIPNVKAYMMGPTDEDPEYYEECIDLVKSQGIEKNFLFTGKVNITDYLGEIDVIVLSSLSEAQPLVLLECGASGTVSVTTDVGSCREIIEGRSDESPKIGHAGIVCELSNPEAISKAMEKLFVNSEFYHECSKNIVERIKRYYLKADQHKAYKDLYQSLMDKEL